MNRTRTWRISAAVSVALLGLIAAPREADASGYLTARFGTDHGTPAQPNTFAIYYNPAALGGTKGTTITGDLSVLLRFARYNRTNDALSPNSSDRNDPSYVNANTGMANLTNLLALPFAGVHTDFGTENFHAGYAIYVPFGGFATWDRRAGVPGVPGSTDGVQRWHNISGQILAIYNTFAFAYRIAPARLSLGVSVSPIIHQVKTVRARNADGSDDTFSPSGSLIEGRSLLDASGVNIGASAGIYWEATDDLRLGLSYNTQPGFGETRLGGTLRTQLADGSESKADVDFLQSYPDLVRFGVDYRATDRLTIRSDFEFVRWSLFKRQCVVETGAECAVEADGKRIDSPEGQRVQLNVPRNWNNAIGVRIGPGYMVTKDIEAFGSLGFTSPAVPKSTIDASTIDSQRLYLTFGAKVALSQHFALAGSYNHIYFFPVNTNGANDQNISGAPSNTTGGGAYNASRSPSADGRYQSQIGFVNVNLAYTF
jgi:long-chain fatty acid transport protein